MSELHQLKKNTPKNPETTKQIILRMEAKFKAATKSLNTTRDDRDRRYDI